MAWASSSSETAPARPRSAASARSTSPATSASVSGLRVSSSDRDSSGEITEKLGFSVVAAIKVTSRFSTAGSSTSCWVLEKRCTSSTKSTVDRPARRSRRAWSSTARTSLTPAVTADSSTNAAAACRDTTAAIVVLPDPGGPQRNTDIASPAASRPQRRPRRKQVRLTDDLVQGARAHPHRQRQTGRSASARLPPPRPAGRRPSRRRGPHSSWSPTPEVSPNVTVLPYDVARCSGRRREGPGMKLHELRRLVRAANEDADLVNGLLEPCASMLSPENGRRSTSSSAWWPRPMPASPSSAATSAARPGCSGRHCTGRAYGTSRGSRSTTSSSTTRPPVSGCGTTRSTTTTTSSPSGGRTPGPSPT
jgi:hypothetical protein